MSKNESGGFIEFGLNKHNPKLGVVCFSEQKHTHDAIEIKGEKDMPKTWHEGYNWVDLNILVEAYLRLPKGFEDGPLVAHGGGRPRYVEDLSDLYHFVRAFGFKAGAPMFMHVWKSRLPKATNSKTA